MSWASWLLWGFVGTLALTALVSAAYGLGFTRLSLPWLLGSMVTPARDRAKVIGTLIHLGNGWLFALLYVAAFEWWGQAGILHGAAIGLVHAAVVLLVGMPLLPGIHPRMASESADATIVRGLEPPGFLALHYGPGTPLTIVITHVLYGVVLGATYPA